jgi:hypothetical protein
MTLSVIAKSDGTTTVARAARIAAGTLQAGLHRPALTAFRRGSHALVTVSCAMRKSLGNTSGA